MKPILPILLFASSYVAAQSVTFPVDSIKGPACAVVDTVTKQAYPFAPERSKYNVTVTDGLAELKITQMYVNHFEHASSFTYVFPMPPSGSVNSMKMMYKDSVYQAEIMERSTAQHIYDSLSQAGKTAALLLQDRPNIFQQQLASIKTGDTAYIEISVTMPLTYDNGTYELRIPTMVAPRYGAGTPAGTAVSWNPPATAASSELSVNVLIQVGFPITEISSPTHPVSTNDAASDRSALEQIALLKTDDILGSKENYSIRLQPVATYDNKDFILRFTRSSTAQETAIASYLDRQSGDGFFSLNLFPDELSNDSVTSIPREVIFMVDVSGSQSGWPLAKEKEIVNAMLDRLSSKDRFTLMAFDTQHYWAFDSTSTQPVNASTLATARQFLLQNLGGGGTELLSSVDAILKLPKSSELNRTFVFLTDGFVSNDAEVINRIDSDPSEPTVFTFGAGDNLNQYFLDQAAKVGNGVSTMLTSTETAETAVEKAWGKLIAPQIDNISLDFGSIGAFDTIMIPSRKLYKGMPVTCYGRYKSGMNQNVTVNGYKNGTPVSYATSVSFADGATLNRMIPKLWAKQMIEKLDLEDGNSESYKDSIISLSVKYQVLSKYTAFLAAKAELANGDNMVDTSFGATEIKPVDQLQKGLSWKFESGRILLYVPQGVGINMLRIYDLRGRVVFQLDLSQYQGTQVIINESMLNGSLSAAGIYLMSIQTAKGFLTSKFTWN